MPIVQGFFLRKLVKTGYKNKIMIQIFTQKYSYNKLKTKTFNFDLNITEIMLKCGQVL